MIDMSNLKEVLENNIVNLSFSKKDGSIRNMQATLKPDLIPSTNSENNLPKDTISIFSIDDQGWRSFRKENFISAKII